MPRVSRLHMAGIEAALLIVSHDDALLESLGGKLGQWGATVLKRKPGECHAGPGRIVDVILVDVRQQAEKMFAGLKGIRESLPCAEMVLINSSGNINASMAGMRAGASDELTVPFDMDSLRRKLAEACQRSRKRLAKTKKNHRSFLQAFEDAMSAAAFAQAGEFATAISMIDRPESGQESDPANTGVRGGFEQENKEKR